MTSCSLAAERWRRWRNRGGGHDDGDLLYRDGDAGADRVRAGVPARQGAWGRRWTTWRCGGRKIGVAGAILGRGRDVRWLDLPEAPHRGYESAPALFDDVLDDHGIWRDVGRDRLAALDRGDGAGADLCAARASAAMSITGRPSGPCRPSQAIFRSPGIATRPTPFATRAPLPFVDAPDAATVPIEAISGRARSRSACVPMGARSAFSSAVADGVAAALQIVHRRAKAASGFLESIWTYIICAAI